MAICVTISATGPGYNHFCLGTSPYDKNRKISQRGGGGCPIPAYLFHLCGQVQCREKDSTSKHYRNAVKVLLPPLFLCSAHPRIQDQGRLQGVQDVQGSYSSGGPERGGEPAERAGSPGTSGLIFQDPSLYRLRLNGHNTTIHQAAKKHSMVIVFSETIEHFCQYISFFSF